LLRDALLRVGRDFPTARQEALTGHPLAQFIRTDLPNAVRDSLGELSADVIVEGSPGVGNWAFVPWVSVFDPLVTDTATRGYYVVYLFVHGRPEVHLSLNQGATAVMTEFGGRAYEVLRDRAALMRARLPDHLRQFDASRIDLASAGRLPRGYEAGHAFGRKYALNAMPSLEALRADINLMIRAYLALTFRGGLEPTPEVIKDRRAERQAAGELLEVRQYGMHRRIERHPRASGEAKRYHGTACQACGFSFVEGYGELGAGFIEAHHLRPLSSLEEGVPVRYDVATDFAVLCSNCHRMIHRTSDPSDMEGFRRLVRRP
jgi:5-methylcytosine-specific restriction enzyme A